MAQLLPTIPRQVAEAFDAASCRLYECTAHQGSVTVVAAWTEDGRRVEIPGRGCLDGLGEGDAGAASLRPQVCEYRRGDPAAHLWGAGEPVSVDAEHVLETVLVADGEVVGVLAVAHAEKGRYFDRNDKALLGDVASHVALAVRNALRHRELQLGNRRPLRELESARFVTSAFIVDAVLDVIVRDAVGVLGASSVNVYTRDSVGGKLVRRTASSADGGERWNGGCGGMLPVVLPCDPSVLSRSAPVVEWASDPAIAEASREALRLAGCRAWVLVPLAVAAEPVGVMVLTESGERRAYSDDEIEFARLLGERVAIALGGARRYEEMESARDELERQLHDRHELLSLSETLLTALDRQSVFEQVASLLAALIGYDALDIALVDEAGAELVVDFAVDADGDHTLGFRVPLNRGVIGAVATSGKPEMVNDMVGDPRVVRAPGTPLRPQASIQVPLRVGDVIIGVLSLDRFGGHVFEQREFELAQLVTNLTAIALRNALLFGELESRASTDALTGLCNRRALDERLREELARAGRYGTPVSVLMIDIDDFKPFNDTYGHLHGDRVLTDLAGALARTTRERVDIVARYGGEEFVVVLPNTAAGGAEAAADRLRQSLGGGSTGAAVAEKIRCEVARTGVPGTGHPPATVTVSVGVAAYPEHGDDAERLLANADKALYLAKGLGKNRVEVYR